MLRSTMKKQPSTPHIAAGPKKPARAKAGRGRRSSPTKVETLASKTRPGGVRLISSSAPMPGDLEAVLREIGKGDARFGGTSFGRGECSLETFLKECRDREEG